MLAAYVSATEQLDQSVGSDYAHIVAMLCLTFALCCVFSLNRPCEDLQGGPHFDRC